MGKWWTKLCPQENKKETDGLFPSGETIEKTGKPVDVKGTHDISLQMQEGLSLE